jgi:cytochrome b
MTLETQTAPSGTVPAARVVIWDPVVRLFHWLVVTGVAANLFFLEEGKRAHRWTGYAIMALVGIRLVWGIVGTRHARFSDFVPSPNRLWSYGRALIRGREPRYVGHNPAGAIMMVMLIVLLLLTGISGWMQELDAFWGVEWVRDLHGLAANAIMVLAGLHAAAAIVESIRHRENLIWSMMTGRKRAASGDDVDHALTSGRG